MELVSVIKIGGNVIDNQDSLENFIKRFSLIQGHKILVHGGGKLATSLGNDLGIPVVMNNGRRVTDEKTLDIVTMVYAGLVNKRIVSLLQKYNVNAIGLSGCDNNLITAVKRPVTDVDYGFVGDVSQVNKSFLLQMIKSGIVPVISPITHDKNGQLLNTNADTIATEIASALSSSYEVTLSLCFEKEGILDDNNCLIKSMNSVKAGDLKAKGTISGGMIPKVDNAFNAINQGVKMVRICNSEAIRVQKRFDEHGTIICI